VAVGIATVLQSRISSIVVVVATVAASIVATPAQVRAAARTASVCSEGAATEVVDGVAAAQERALGCGRRVEVGEKRSEQAQTFANPDGSFTVEVSAVPRRVRRADGGWATVDTSLRRQVDGSVAPVAVAQPLTLSGGGDAPLVSMGTATGPWSLSWPSALPAPRLDGDAALYPDVFAGVDLRVRVLTTGFTYVLVVRTRAALANPGLRRIAVSVSGPALRQRADGGIEAVDSTGAVVLSSGGALMWDSGGGTAAEPSSATGPGDGARSAAVTVSTSGRDLVLVPDAGMLADPEVVLPVYVDPQVAGRNRWAYANSTNANRDDGVARVGLNPDGSGTYRSFFEFPTGAVVGTRILAASFNTVLTHSWSCANTPVSLYWTDGIPAGVNGTRISWATGLLQWLDEQSNHAHKPSTGDGCAGDPQPDQPMRFNNVLTSKVQAWANTGVGAVTLALSTRSSNGANEAATDRWKKFWVAGTFLVINYNSIPRTPDASALTTVGTSQTVGCYTGATAGQPHLNTTGGAHLRATLTDNDGSDNIVGRFEWQDVTAATAVATLPDTPGFPTPHTFDVGLPAASLPNGHSVRWRAHGFDGLDNGGVSAWCQFVVDNATPGQPTLTSNDLPPFPANPPAATAVVGAPGSVTATPASGDTDVIGYYYGVGAVDSAPTIWIPAPGGTAVIPVVPVVSGLNKNFLTVVAVDTAGNRSPVPVSSADAPGTRQFRANAATSQHTPRDVTGDGRADLTILYDAGNNQTKLLNFASTSDGSGVFNPTTPIVNDPGVFPAGKLNTLSGDFNGDGRSDVVAFRDEGGCHTTMSWWLSSANSYVPSNGPVWDSGVGNWCYSNGAKTVAGDFNGDGMDDIGAFYNYGGGRVALWVFTVTVTAAGTGIAGWSIWWDSGPGTWDYNAFRAIAADFNGDGKDDVAQLYDYGSCSTAVFRLTSTGSSLLWPAVPFKAAPGSWCYDRTTQLLAGDFNGDGNDDFQAIYNLGGNAWLLWTFAGPDIGNPTSSGRNSGPSDATRLKAVAGDFNGDGLSDVAHFYNGGTNRVTFFVLYSNGTTYGVENLRWDSNNAGGLEWTQLRTL
jgi:hypothetical protein